MPKTIDSQGWMARATAWELLSLAFLAPNGRLAGALSSGEYAEACAEAFGACDVELGAEALERLGSYRGIGEAEALSEVRRAHTKLFQSLGNKGPAVTPYIGVRDAELKGGTGLLFVGAESMAVERFMRRCGVAKDISAGQVNEPMDHVGTACEFLEFLCLVKAGAVVPAESAEVRETDYAEFLREHFADYALWLSGELKARSACPFYQAASRVLSDFVESELRRLEA